MDPDEAVALAAEVVLTPVSELDPVIRAQIGAQGGDVAVTKEGSRRTSRLVDIAGADLLEEFREPLSIPDAIQRYCARTGRRPLDVLDQSFGLLTRMVRDGFLVRTTDRSETTMGEVETAGGWQVLEPLRLLDDTEVSLVRSPDGRRGVLKRVSAGADAWLLDALTNEAHVLTTIGGSSAPELIEDGVWAQTPYVVVAWRPGLPAHVAAAQVRRPWLPATRRPLATMCLNILDCYVALHAEGFLHGDVQPSNVLVEPESGEAALIDLGLAVRIGEGEQAHVRGGVTTFLTPEAAAAGRAGAPPPAPTVRSEQYAVAVLLYQLLVGQDYLERRLDPDAWNHAVCTQAPRAFVRHGIPPWAAVESVLHRALAKDSHERYASMAAFRAAFAHAARRGQTRGAASPGWQPAGLLDATLDRLVDPDELHRPMPRPSASVNLGAAGVAAFLLRAGGLQERADLLTAADLWIERAKRDAASSPADAFTNTERGLDESTVGLASLYHSAVGVHFVNAQIALALDQRPRADEAIRRLVAASGVNDPRVDLVTGSAGRLVACATLLETSAALGVDDVRDPLRALGDRTSAALLSLVDIDEAVPGTSEAFLGLAHGWAGVAYAALRYVHAVDEPVPEPLRVVLTALADAAQRSNGSAAWPIGSMNDGLLAGWCHGTAGHALLWAEVHRTDAVPGVDALSLALAAGEHAWRQPPPGTGHLCCGAAGQAYAFLALSRITGDGAYVDRARDRLDRAVGFVGTPGMLPSSLYKGDLGVALLEGEIAEPYLAAMPVFEPDQAAG